MSDGYRVLEFDEMQDNLEKINERAGPERETWPRPHRRDSLAPTVRPVVRNNRGV